MNGIISDTHCHNYSQFAVTNEDGINSRLQIILDEITRSAITVKECGGNKLYHCGDLFHVRGNITPSVLNPTLKCFENIIRMGVTPIILCGNHDAEFKLTNDLGSAVDAFSKIGCAVINHMVMLDDVLLCPWCADAEAMINNIDEYISVLDKKPTTLMMHASLDGVFAHIKGSGVLDPKKIFERFPNFKRIFAGHLHKHQLVYESKDHKAYSVGSICQHNWGDAGHEAGFMLFNDKEEVFVPTKAPRFFDACEYETIEDLGKDSTGNYVRVTVEMTDSEVKKFRKALEKYNPAGITIISHVPVEARADRLNVSNTESLDSIVGRFINDRIEAEPSVKEKILKVANEIMRGVE